MTEHVKFGKVIVPVDGSDRSLAVIPLAAQIPADTHQILTVLAPGYLNDFSIAADPEGWRADAERIARDQLAQAAALFSVGEVEQSLLYGDPAEEIIDAAASDDLIVMSTSGEGDASRLIFGSVADRVARHSHSPVLLVGPESTTTEIRRIIVPLDGSDRSHEALPVAAGLAKALNIPIQLVRAIDVQLLRQAVRAGATAAAAYAESLPNVQRALREYLEIHQKTLEQQGLTVSTAVADGVPADEIVALAQLHDLIVMTTHGRGGVKRWLLGSVAEKVTRNARTPVMIIRST